MDNKKIFIFLLIGVFMISMISMVSATWYNPFTWGTENVVKKNTGTWVETFNDNPDFYSVIPNKTKHDADIYLCSKTATKKQDLKDLDFATSFNKNQKELQTKDKLKSIEYNGAVCYYYKPTKDEKYLKFGEHSTHFIYTNESITAYSDSAFFGDEYVEIGTLSLSTGGYNYKNGKPNIDTSRGKQKLTHTFYIENYTVETITNLRTVDMNTNEEVERNAILKYLSYTEEEENIYENTCEVITEEYQSCERTFTGTELVQKENWKNMNSAIVGENYIVGVFMDLNGTLASGDYIDIDFNYYGVSVLDSPINWATVSVDDLIAYYSFNETSGTTLNDIHNTLDGTNTGAELGATGIIGDAYNFVSANTDYISMGTNVFDLGGQDWTYSIWFKADDITNTGKMISTNGGRQAIDVDSGNIRFICEASIKSYSISTGNWYHAVAVKNSTGMFGYINGSLVTSDTGATAPCGLVAGDAWIGGNAYSGGRHYFDGIIDEVAIFNRSLSEEEIISLAGILEYPFESGTAPSVTLTSPSNYANLTSANVDFIATVTDDQYVENVTLYLDGVANETKTTHVNGSYTFSKTVAEGYHNWSILAYDNQSLSNQSATWYFNYTQPPVFVELLSPDNAIISNNITLNMSCWGYKDIGITQLNMTIDGVLNQTVTNSTQNENLTISQLLDFSEGEHNWSCSVTDGMSYAMSSTRTFIINTTPFIDWITPPTLVNYANITQEYIPMKVNVSTLYFENITYSLRDVNGTNYTKFYTNKTYDINFTDIPDAHYHYDATVCATTGECNTTETRHINHDNNYPTINITSPSILNDLGYDGLSVNFTAKFSDINLDSCWYNYNGTNTTFPCTNDQFNTTSFVLSNHNTDMIFYANDTFGNLLIESFDWDYVIYYINNSYENLAIVGETSSFGYEAYWLNDSYSSINSYVNWNGVRKPLATTQTSGDYVNATSLFLLTGLTADTNITFYWEFVIDGTFYNSSTYTQEVRTIKIDDCTNYSNYIFNFTLKDEETNSIINATNESGLVEIDLFINSDGSEILQYSSTEALTNPVYICSELDLKNRGFNFDLDIGFSSTDRVNEFYFVDKGEIETGDTPFNISLMDLKTADSTSFLFNYFDVDGLPVDEAIIQVWRKYIGDGAFREVERAKSDQNGDTIVHLVEEDVIYYFVITLNDTILYTTSTYNALCQSTPCTIQIEASGEGASFPTDWDLIDGGAYNIDDDPTTRTVTMNYALDDLAKMELTVYKYSSDGSYSVVDTSSETGTSGSIVLSVPQVAGNVSFFATVEKDDDFINSEWVDFTQKSSDFFGIVLSLFLSALIILSLGLFAIYEGAGTIGYVILGIIISGALGLIRTELSTGVNIVTYLILAGGILLWKLTRGRS